MPHQPALKAMREAVRVSKTERGKRGEWEGDINDHTTKQTMKQTMKRTSNEQAMSKQTTKANHQSNNPAGKNKPHPPKNKEYQH